MSIAYLHSDRYIHIYIEREREERKGLTVLRLVREKPGGERGVQGGSFKGEEKIRGDGNTRCHVFED